MVFLVVYGAVFALAVRVFGLRRVVLGLLIFVALAIYTALRTLASLAGRRS